MMMKRLITPLIVLLSAAATCSGFFPYERQYFFVKVRVPYRPLPVMIRGSMISIIDIDDDFYFVRPKCHPMRPTVPRAALDVKVRDGNRIVPVRIPSSEYRWLGSQAISPVLRYVGGNRYLGTVTGKRYTMHGAKDAAQYLRQIQRSLVAPTYLAPYMGIVFIVWGTKSTKPLVPAEMPRKVPTKTPAKDREPAFTSNRGAPPRIPTRPPSKRRPTFRPPHKAAPISPPPFTVPAVTPRKSRPTSRPTARPTRRPQIIRPPTKFPTFTQIERPKLPPIIRPTFSPARRPTITLRPVTVAPTSPPTRRPFFNRPLNIGSLNIDELLKRVMESGKGTVKTVTGGSRNRTRTVTKTTSTETDVIRTRLPDL